MILDFDTINAADLQELGVTAMKRIWKFKNGPGKGVPPCFYGLLSDHQIQDLDFSEITIEQANYLFAHYLDEAVLQKRIQNLTSIQLNQVTNQMPIWILCEKFSSQQWGVVDFGKLKKRHLSYIYCTNPLELKELLGRIPQDKKAHLEAALVKNGFDPKKMYQKML